MFQPIVVMRKERDFIYVTTQNLSADQLQAFSEEVGSDQSLLVCCSAYRGITAANAATNLPTVEELEIELAAVEDGVDRDAP